MRYAIIEYGVVKNVADADEALEPNWVRSDEAQIGWLFDGKEFARPASSTPPPASTLPDAIPMLNLHLVLIDDGHLTTVQEYIASMEGDDGLRAQALWTQALTARRDNWLVNILWPKLYADEAAFNDAWRRAAALNP